MDMSNEQAVMAIARKVDWQLEDMSYFRKCGEITASPDVECFGLNCRFCSGICLQFEVFMQHLREQHSKDILDMYSTTTTTTCEKKTQTNAFIDMQGDISENETVIVGVEQLHADADKLTQIMCSNENSSNSLSSQDAELKILSSNLDNSNGTFTIQLEFLPENNHKMAAHNDEVSIEEPMECILADRAQLAELMTVSCTTSSLSSEQTFCIVENTLPDILLSVDDALEPSKSTSSGCEPNKCHETTKIQPTISPQVPASTNGNAITLTSTLSGEQKKHTKIRQKHKQCNESIISNAIEENRDIVSYLLDCFNSSKQQQQLLWTSNQAFQLSKGNKSIYEEISKSLLRDKKVSLSAEEIFNVMKNLIVKYFIETEKTQKSTDYKPKLWCYEQMHFLTNTCSFASSIQDNESKLDIESSCQRSYDKINDNRDILTALLKAFKDESSLWNPKNADYIERQHRHQISNYEGIAKQLEEHCKLKISARDCFTEIQKMCTQYRKELHLMHKFKDRRYVAKLWCFNQLEFLRDIYEQQFVKSINKCQRFSSKQVVSIQFENSKEYMEFIELYKNHPTLWNVDHTDYRSTTYRKQALSHLLEELNQSQTAEYTMAQLQKTLDELRRDFSANKRRQFMSKSTLKIAVKPELEFLTAHIGPFRCEECTELIKTTDQYKIHMSQHTGTHPFNCGLCGKGFQMSGNMTVHIRRHKRDFPYKCEVCNKSFATSTEVSIHKRIHTGERPYDCDLCDKSFKTWSFFDIHRRIHLKQSTFHCPICDKGFYEKNRYTDHMNGHLNIRKHKCTDCKKSFTTVANLKKHLELHLPVKKYKCLICGKRFAQYASLRWHKTKKHVDEAIVMET